MTPPLSPSVAVSDRTQSPQAQEPRRVPSQTLLGGGRRLIIDHGGATYTLLLTRNDKLILTK